ncbi:ATP-binding cassette domain-containing protein [Candidatus Micrarchaeota archaeon]|nr:ATP-binding cassette domain-containing protein [Candidatus Micrarchaeota archaeon]
MHAIETHQLTKAFGALTAVHPLDIHVKKGEVFGLLGPNGAGKTTTISMLVTLLSPSGGTAKVNGFDVQTQPDLVRQSIGIVFQDESIDDELTAWENLDMHGRLYGMPWELRKKRIEEVLKLVGLQPRQDDVLKTYSGGMIRRLEIARGLMHHPNVLFLDEPTLGLDPQTRRHIWTYIRKLNRDEGVTVILTTHYMEEADFLCDRIAIMDQGKIVALDTPKKLKERDATLHVASGKIDELYQALSAMNPVRQNGKILIETSQPQRSLKRVLSIAEKRKLALTEIDVKKPTLEDIFVELTGHSIRDEKAGTSDRFKAYNRAMTGRRK